MLSPDDRRPVLSPDVHSTVLEGKAVLLHLTTGKYFSLNEVGTRVFALLQEGRSLGEMRRTLGAEYEADQAVIDADLDELLRALEAASIVR